MILKRFATLIVVVFVAMLLACNARAQGPVLQDDENHMSRGKEVHVTLFQSVPKMTTQTISLESLMDRLRDRVSYFAEKDKPKWGKNTSIYRDMLNGVLYKRDFDGVDVQFYGASSSFLFKFSVKW